MPVQYRLQLSRRDKHRPLLEVLRAAGRKPPLRGQFDDADLALHRPVDGVVEKATAGTQHPGNLSDDRLEVRHMFEHITARDNIELAVADRKLLPPSLPIVDQKAVRV